MKQGNQTIVKIDPAMDALITIETDKGNVVCAVLPREQIHRSVETVFNGQKTYLISNHDLAVVKTDDGTGDAVRLTGKGENEFELYSYPSVTFAGMNQTETVGIFSKITASVPKVKLG